MSEKVADTVLETTESSASSKKDAAEEKGWLSKGWDWLVYDGIDEASTALDKATGLVGKFNTLKDRIKGVEESPVMGEASKSSSDKSMNTILPIIGVGGVLALVLSKIL